MSAVREVPTGALSAVLPTSNGSAGTPPQAKLWAAGGLLSRRQCHLKAKPLPGPPPPPSPGQTQRRNLLPPPFWTSLPALLHPTPAINPPPAAWGGACFAPQTNPQAWGGGALVESLTP